MSICMYKIYINRVQVCVECGCVSSAGVCRVQVCVECECV